MTNFAKVKDHSGLIREMYSKAILNVDDQALSDHRKKKVMMREVINNSQKINKMENDIQEIKQMLLAIVEKTKV
jgi:hypothetical protein